LGCIKNHEATKDTKKHEERKGRRELIKIFAGSRGGFFKKSPWPPEARVLIEFYRSFRMDI
jgi:hypothetical protein